MSMQTIIRAYRFSEILENGVLVKFFSKTFTEKTFLIMNVIFILFFDYFLVYVGDNSLNSFEKLQYLQFLK